MSKMKWVKEISEDPQATEQLFNLTTIAEQTKKPYFSFQAQNITTSVARAMCTLIKDELTRLDSYDKEERL